MTWKLKHMGILGKKKTTNQITSSNSIDNNKIAKPTKAHNSSFKNYKGRYANVPNKHVQNFQKYKSF